MVPTRQAAGLLRVNRKTVQRHYRLLRTRLTAEKEGWQHGMPRREERKPENPLAAIAVCGMTIKVDLFPEEGSHTQGSALIYPRKTRVDPIAGMGDLQLWIPAGCDRAENDAILKFWGFAGRLAGRYRGRCWKDLPLFLQEVAFRCNRRDDPRVIGDLVALLAAGGVGDEEPESPSSP